MIANITCTLAGSRHQPYSGYAGETWNILGHVSRSDGTRVDISNSEITWVLQDTWVANGSNGTYIVDAANGTFNVRLDSSNTTWNFGSYNDYIQIQYTSGEKYIISDGLVKVLSSPL